MSTKPFYTIDAFAMHKFPVGCNSEARSIYANLSVTRRSIRLQSDRNVAPIITTPYTMPASTLTDNAHSSCFLILISPG